MSRDESPASRAFATSQLHFHYSLSRRRRMPRRRIPHFSISDFLLTTSYPQLVTSMSRRSRAPLRRKSLLAPRPVWHCYKNAYFSQKRFKEPHAYPNKLSKSLCDPTQNQWISAPFLRPTARYFAEILTDQMSFVPDNFLKRREG